MSLKTNLISQAINKVKSFASGIGQNVSNSINDNQGWVRQGKFTPVQELKTQLNPVNFITNQINPVFSQISTPQKTDYLKSFGKGLVNTSTFGLVQPKYQPQTQLGKIGNVAGNVAGFVNPFGPGQMAMRGIDKLGVKAITKFAPKLTTNLLGKVTGGLLKEAAQTGAYVGGKYLAGKAGLRPDEKITGKSVLQDLALGAGMRGITTPGIASKALGLFKNAKNIDNETITEIVKLSRKADVGQLKGEDKLALNRIFEGFMGKETRKGTKFESPEFKLKTLMDEIDMQNIPNLGRMGITDQSKGVIPEVGGVKTKKEPSMMDIQYDKNSKAWQYNPNTDSIDPVKGLPEVKTNIPNTQIGKVLPQDGISIPTKQTELPVSNKPLQSQDILPLNQGEIKQQIVKNKAQLKKVLAENPNANVRIELTPNKGQIATLGQVPDRADVAATLPNRLNNFVEDVLGYSIKNPTGGTKNASLWTRTLRKGQTAITTKVEEGLGSENPYIRNAATGLQNFFRGLGMSPERQAASMELRGEMGVANDRAYNVMDTLYKSLGNNKKSLERINAVLDPEISTTKVTFDQLSKTEKQVYGLIREGFDLVHDTSYANGHISPELYVKNKGKYVPRLYDVTELPAEVNKFVTSGKKITSDLYKQRKDVDTWKQDNSLNDPVYALGKRLSQVQTNSAIKKYTDFLSSNQRFISDVERSGFTKLSDSPAYGELSGKYVLNSAAEDLKGFFFANQGMQNLYDVFRAYDRLAPRQLQKKLLTVFNPTTNVGNIVSDQVFGWVTGVDPFTLNKNLIKTKSDPALFKQLNDYLTQKGITGTDITRTDFTNKLTSIDELARGKKPGKLKTAAGKVQSFYGGTDDSYKVAALQSLLDKGFTLEEATRKVSDGFQNYANVGKFYDLAAKTPVIGKPFMKFQGDLIRIIKNGAINNPLGLISFLGTLKAISYLSSKASGESDEDRKTRENRFAAPMIPGLNIPLTWQTPIGEINVARYISPFYANNETTNMFSNMIPGVPNIDPKKDVASNIAMNVNDPLVSPLVQLAVNRDFRGKNISDPNENKYQPSTLTSGEKLTNQAIFAGRAYLPPPVNSAIDVPQVAITGKNMYGSPQTVGQSVARLGGIKISDMSAEQVQGIRDKDAIYQQNSNEYLQKQIQSVKKEQLTGGISQETANNRIANLESQKKEVNQSLIKGSGDEISYINDSGNMATVNLTKYDDIANLPSDNKYNSAIKESKQYSAASSIMDNTALSTEQQQTALARLGIDKTSADYYKVANDNTNLKTLYVMDKVQNATDQTNLIEGLANLRKQVNGQMIASNAVLDNLVDEGIISKSEATELKKYKFEGGKLTSIKKTGTKAKKGKKIKVSIKRPPKLKALKTKAIKIKTVKTKTYKPVKFKVPKKLKVKKIAIRKSV